MSFGIAIFLHLKLSLLLSFPLFIANGLVGDLGFGEIGGVNEEVLVLFGSGNGESDFGVDFLIEFLLSRFEHGCMLVEVLAFH